MKLLLLFLVVYFPIYCHGKETEAYIGCFADKPTRAMPIRFKPGGNLIKECEKEAAFRGYKVYGVQNQVECWSGPDAHNTYSEYGPSTNCQNGLGGQWANSVYRVLLNDESLAGLLGDLIAKASSIDDIDVGAFVDSSSKLLNLSSSQWKENPKIADKFLSASKGLLSLGMNATTPVAATSDLMAFSVAKVDSSNRPSLVFPDYDDPTFSEHKSSNSFVVPTINTSDSANIGGFIYTNLHERLATSLDEEDAMFRSDLSQQIISKVLSCQVNPPISFGKNTNETVIITLEHNVPMRENSKAICAFWKHPENDNSSGIWSTEGCNVISWNATQTRCNCTHLTNFAILMQYQEVQVDNHHKRALAILTNIGCSLSLAAIFVTVTVYLVYGLYRTPNFHIHMNLCLAIAMAQIFLLTASKAKKYKNACVVVSAFFHYFCLSIFTWMFVEGLQIYRKVVSIFSSSLNLAYCHLIGWGSPVLIVVITYVSRKKHYADTKTCWLSPNYGIRWAFIGPVLVVIMINVVVTVITLFKRLHLRSVVTKEMSFKLRTSLRALVVLLPLFGITWLVGILGFTSDTVVAMYIFVVLNASQGLLIFVFHCALNAEVRKAVLQGRRHVHARTGTLSSSKKVPLQKIPSKNSDCSNSTSRPTSCRSVKEQAAVGGLDNIHLTDDAPPTPRSNYLAP